MVVGFDALGIIPQTASSFFFSFLFYLSVLIGHKIISQRWLEAPAFQWRPVVNWRSPRANDHVEVWVLLRSASARIYKRSGGKDNTVATIVLKRKQKWWNGCWRRQQRISFWCRHAWCANFFVLKLTPVYVFMKNELNHSCIQIEIILVKWKF